MPMNTETPGGLPMSLPPRHSRVQLALVAALLASPLVGPAGAAPRFQTRFAGQIANASPGFFTVGIAIGDLDADGNLDVVAPGASEAMAVLLGRGDGTLAPPITVGPAGASLPFVTLGDFDGDGHLDIVGAFSGDAAVYYGDGTGRNWLRAPLTLNGNCMSVTACDVDGDGRPDVVALINHTPPLGGPPSSDPPSLRTWLSRPGRTFQLVDDPQPVLNLTPQRSEARDLNGDGKTDLVIAGRYGNPLCIGLGHGDGTFTFTVRSDVSGEAWGCDVRDATGDGKLDLVVAGSFGLSIDAGLGDGTFGAPQSFNPPGWLESPRDAAVGDVTGDGIPDLVVSDRTYDDLVVRPGLGAGLYGAPQRCTLGCVLAPMRLADMNADGVLDVVGISTPGGQNSSPPGVLIALGDGAGHFGVERPAVSYANTGAFSTVAGDFDGDGRPDLATVRSSYPSAIAQVLRNDGARHFLAQPEISIPDYPVSWAFATDLDEDGHLDLVTSAFNCRWLRGLGDGTFAPPVLLSSAGAPVLAAQDVTEDGHADLVLQLNGGLRILPGLGNGGFGPSFDVSLPSFNPGRVVVGDFDGDHHPDFAMTGNAEVRVLHGPFFPGMPEVQEGWSVTGIATLTGGDADGDGTSDVVDAFAANSWIGTVETRLHQTDGTLGDPVVSSWPRSAMADLKLVDLDHDGHFDLLGPGDGGWYVGLGDGAGHFAIEGLEASGVSLAQFAVDPVDFDGDGRLDLVVNTYPAGTAGLEVCFGRDPVPPSVANVASTPGPLLPIGLSATLAWAASDDVGLGTASAFVSRHGAAGPFEPIGSAPAGGGTMPWTVTGPPSDSVVFKVVVRDLDGNTAWSKSAGLLSVSAATAVGDVAPDLARLGLAARTNPVRERMGFTLDLPHAGHATLVLVDVQGRRVATLLDADLPAGSTAIERPLPRLGAGLYFARLDVGREHAIARTIVTR